MDLIYKEFPKIYRYSRDCIVTEKLDGTNGLIEIMPFGETMEGAAFIVAEKDGLAMLVGSRTRYITPADDNYGFAKWAQENATELFGLGEGRHHGEWWGQGIQRKYGLDEKRFSLFDRHRWAEDRPTCCHVVPEVWRGDFDVFQAKEVMTVLQEGGSLAAPGFMKPEGIVIYHTQGNVMFKKTFEKDDHGKGYGA